MISNPVKQSTQTISFRTTTNEITIETGVILFSLAGTGTTVWHADTLQIPVGAAMPQASYVGGLAMGCPASFQYSQPGLGLNTTPGTEAISIGSSVAYVQIPVASVKLAGVVPGCGCAVDSASVAYSTQAGQPVATFAVAAFAGTLLLRVAYTVHIVSV